MQHKNEATLISMSTILQHCTYQSLPQYISPFSPPSSPPHVCIITQLSYSSSPEPNRIAKLEAELVQAEEDLKVSCSNVEDIQRLSNQSHSQTPS